MAVSELQREAAERKRGLTDLSKVIRNVRSSLTRILAAITKIKKRKAGLPSMDDLNNIVKLITEAMKLFDSLSKLIPTITQVFKI